MNDLARGRKRRDGVGVIESRVLPAIPLLKDKTMSMQGQAQAVAASAPAYGLSEILVLAFVKFALPSIIKCIFDSATTASPAERTETLKRIACENYNDDGTYNKHLLRRMRVTSRSAALQAGDSDEELTSAKADRYSIALLDHARNPANDFSDAVAECLPSIGQIQL